MKKNLKEVFIKEYDYALPHHRIAEFPLQERDGSKLLVYHKGTIADEHFKNLHQYLPENSALILNNTRVIEARILFQKTTGGVIEIFCLEPANETVEKSIVQKEKVQWKCFIGGASKWKSGQLLQKELQINNIQVQLTARYIEKKEDSFIIEFLWQPAHFSFADILHAAGAIPLPPYIKRKAVETDAERYQTVFAKYEGSVAAPTAALHFTKKIFNDLKEKNIAVDFITLHVGAGTFKPVKTETIAEHQMHAEDFHVSLKTLEQLIKKETLVAVGTTSLRTLESLYWLGLKCSNNEIKNESDFILQQWEAYELDDKNFSYQQSIEAIISYMKKNDLQEIFCRTSLLIVPGYGFKSAQALITNFHQPQSTLLLLVSAFIGEDWKKIYNHALQNNYRFLSYGDSSLLFRN